MREIEVLTGTCRFCGQMKGITVIAGTDEGQADEMVTENCYCIGGMRNRLTNRTLDSVNQLFGQNCGGGFLPLEEEELDFLIQCARALCSEVAGKVSITLKSGGVCQMKFKDLECVEVKREEKHVMKRGK